MTNRLIRRGPLRRSIRKARSQSCLNLTGKENQKEKKKKNVQTAICVFKGATSRFTQLEKFRLNVSSSSFVIRVNLLHL